jgi:hypothetical protein
MENTLSTLDERQIGNVMHIRRNLPPMLARLVMDHLYEHRKRLPGMTRDAFND